MQQMILAEGDISSTGIMLPLQKPAGESDAMHRIGVSALVAMQNAMEDGDGQLSQYALIRRKRFRWRIHRMRIIMIYRYGSYFEVLHCRNHEESQGGRNHI
jgi:hypothetical protein